MKPITDAEVSELPVDRGRAELLEAIMTTPVLAPDTAARQPTGPRRPRRTVLAVGAAAAAVAAIVAIPMSIGGDERPAPTGESASSPTPVAPAADGRLYPVSRGELPAGWKYEGASARELVSLTYGREDTYQGEQVALTFSIEIRDAEDYDQIVSEESSQGGVRAGTIDVSGRVAPVWKLVEKPGAATADPCTVGCVTHWSAITPVENGQYVLIGGSGYGPGTLSEQDWRTLVGSVELTDLAGFEAWAPADLLFGDEIDASVKEALSQTTLPAGVTPTVPDRPVFQDRDRARGDAALAAMCAWADVYRDGDKAAQGEARRQLSRADQWPVFDNSEYLRMLSMAVIGRPNEVDAGAISRLSEACAQQ